MTDAVESAREASGLRRASVLVALVAVILTGALSYGAWRLNNANENRLLHQQARQAGSALTAGIQSTQTPLVASAAAARTGGATGFSSVMMPLVGDGKQFAAAALWQVGSAQPVVVIGDPKLAHSGRAAIMQFLGRSPGKARFSVLPMLDGAAPRLGYSYNEVLAPTQYIAYAESGFPADRTHVQRRNDAYRNVNYALYVGSAERTADLVGASTAHLPIGGRRASVVTPFGDTTLLLVMSPVADLGGWLSANVWWIVLIAGLAIGASATALVEGLARRRDRAVGLVEEVSRLYEEQRGIAVTLQRALLPSRVPSLPGLQVATRYEPAASMSEVGGDWFDVIQTGEHTLLLIVGDVSGHGIVAATTMAALRFAATAFASESDSPSGVIGKLEKMVDLVEDGHFATIVCARIDVSTGRLTVANAGHPDVIIADQDGARAVGSVPGPPVGMQRRPPAETTVMLGRSGTLLAFTDGLFERRGENLDVGFARVRACLEHTEDDLEALLTRAIAEVVPPDHADDLAMVGVRWQLDLDARGAA